MEPTEAIAFVRRYNEWRRGYQGIEQPQPYQIGQAIDAICDHAELATERELADRLAQTLANVQYDYASTGAITTQEVDESLAAWKEVRSGTI